MACRVQAVEAGKLQVALAQYTTAIKQPDDSSETQQNTFELAQVHQSRGAVLHMLGNEYTEDSAAAESLGVQNAHATIAKLAVQMAQAFPACLTVATNQVKAGVKKEEGNTLLKAKKFAQALESYSAALELDPTEHTIWSNRSMCYERLFQWAQSEADARKTIELKPGFVKGHVRLVKALKEAGKEESEIAAAMASGKEAVDAKDLKGLEAEVRCSCLKLKLQLLNGLTRPSLPPVRCVCSLRGLFRGWWTRLPRVGAVGRWLGRWRRDVVFASGAGSACGWRSGSDCCYGVRRVEGCRCENASLRLRNPQKTTTPENRPA